MNTTVALPTSAPSAATAPRNVRAATTEPAWVKWLLIGVALVFLTLFLFVPLAVVFFEALKKGVGRVRSPRSPTPTRCRRSSSRCWPPASRCR